MIGKNRSKVKYTMPHYCAECNGKYFYKRGMLSRFCCLSCSQKNRKKMELKLLGSRMKQTLMTRTLIRCKEFHCYYTFKITLSGIIKEKIKFKWRKQK